MSIPRVVISMGDPNGIGPEVILGAFSDRRMFEMCTPIVVGSKSIFNYYGRALGLADGTMHFLREGQKPQNGKLNILMALDEKFEPTPGQPSQAAGKMAYESLEGARKWLEEQDNSSTPILVTAPIDKSSIQSDAFSFPGHTEYLGAHFGTEGASLMILMNDGLKIALVSGHIPVSQIASSLSAEKIFQTLKRLNDTLIRDFRIRKPRMAVLGLNPHAGDHGLLGSEEEKIIAPALAQAQDANILAYGPFAADGFFGASKYEMYDAVVAMYHDQGLAPFKALSFGNGVNYTAGLSIIRTSPDHGTAYDLAGSGTAHPDSFRAAVFTAIDAAKNRSEYGAITADPLKRQKLPRK